MINSVLVFSRGIILLLYVRISIIDIKFLIIVKILNFN